MLEMPFCQYILKPAPFLPWHSLPPKHFLLCCPCKAAERVSLRNRPGCGISSASPRQLASITARSWEAALLAERCSALYCGWGSGGREEEGYWAQRWRHVNGAAGLKSSTVRHEQRDCSWENRAWWRQAPVSILVSLTDVPHDVHLATEARVFIGRYWVFSFLKLMTWGSSFADPLSTSKLGWSLLEPFLKNTMGRIKKLIFLKNSTQHFTNCTSGFSGRS